jgi:hypothetical protein
MDVAVTLILATGVFFVLATCLVVLFIALKTKENTDAILAEIRQSGRRSP